MESQTPLETTKRKSLNIGLIGFGKMGKMVESVAMERGHQILGIVHQTAVNPEKRKITPQSLKDVDICIDFSHPSCIIDNIWKMAKMKKSIVVGTSGWYDQIGEVKKIVEEHNIGFLYAPNFSLGVALFKRVVEEACRLIGECEEYDVAGLELHHNQKVDSPSGTAISLAEVICKNFKGKTEVLYDRCDEEIDPKTLHFSSVRCGSIPGTHEVMFDSPFDTVTLTHQARSREGFVLGAVKAAEWLDRKKGFFSIESLLGC